jgi:hypothetical protein
MWVIMLYTKDSRRILIKMFPRHYFSDLIMENITKQMLKPCWENTVLVFEVVTCIELPSKPCQMVYCTGILSGYLYWAPQQTIRAGPYSQPWVDVQQLVTVHHPEWSPCRWYISQTLRYSIYKTQIERNELIRNHSQSSHRLPVFTPLTRQMGRPKSRAKLKWNPLFNGTGFDRNSLIWIRQ